MANYYLDCEFLEGTQKEKFPISLFRKETKPTIDLISIGIVAEYGREFYAVSKDFNLKEAWNRFDWKEHKSTHKEDEDKKLVQKVYWIRENVLKPIFDELLSKSMQDKGDFVRDNFFTAYSGFTYSHLKALIKYYGKTNEQIAFDVKNFCGDIDSRVRSFKKGDSFDPKFYAYYADYDWVAFCWLFGKMMDLPNGFPMYCNDLKQDYDFFNANFIERKKRNAVGNIHKSINELKDFKDYPKQENEHSAICDARFNRDLHKFLKSI